MLPRLILALCLLAAMAHAAEPVAIVRVPNGGIKPSLALDAAGVLHLAYFAGDPKGGDAFYVTSRNSGIAWSAPLRVNSQAGSVLGVSSIRGPRLALGRGGRVHVLWNGSSVAKPRAPLNPAQPADSPHNGTPLLYTRLDDTRRAFEPQRNVMSKTCALDGGSDIAADSEGRVFAVWQAMLPGAKGEAERAIYVARSEDDGTTFAEEKNALPQPIGACACCSVAATADESGALAILFRAATGGSERGMQQLTSRDDGTTFTSKALDSWALQSCPMSSAALLPLKAGFLTAWQRKDAVWLSGQGSADLSAGEDSRAQKHPTLARNTRGDVLLAWTEGMGWNQGGDMAWKIVPAVSAANPQKGRSKGVPAHGSLAAFARADGSFVVMY